MSAFPQGEITVFHVVILNCLTIMIMPQYVVTVDVISEKGKLSGFTRICDNVTMIRTRSFVMLSIGWLLVFGLLL